MINPFWADLFVVIFAWLGYYFGYVDGKREILYRDHVQATAGIFIDGYDKNKIYKIVQEVKFDQ